MFIPSRVYAGWMTFSQRSPAASASEAAFRPGSACLRDTTLLHGTAAGINAEATEKLYERHYLVIKIVSSFFACLIKFLYL